MTTALNSLETQELDTAFFAILAGMKGSVNQAAAQASETILTSASSYVSDSARAALANFYKLYTAGADPQAGTMAVNRNVDDVFDQVKEQVEAGGADAPIEILEDQSATLTRLSFSGVQKELEAIIRMDDGIRKKLIPILANLQFEDAVRQRLDHIEQAWSILIGQLRSPEDLDLELVTLEMSGLTTSVAERKLFYNIVLKSEPPPEANVDDIMMFDI